MASSDPALRRIARQFVGFDQRLKNLETVPQLANSSLDDHGMPVYDADGNLVAKIGKQDDGTWGAPPLDGPVPPQPTGVSVKGDAGVIHVAWGGAFASAATAPLDFDGVEVLIGGELAGAIHDRDGGSTTIGADEGTHVVSWRTRSLAARVSAASAGLVVQVLAPPSKIAADLEAAEGRIGNAETVIEATKAAIDQAKADVTAAQARLDSLDSETLPGIREQLEAQAQQAAADLAELDGKLTGLDGAVDAKPDFDDLTLGNLRTGTVAADEAVIDSLFVQTFVGHKITATELVIPSVDAAGNLAAGSAGATVIKDGAITTPKLTVTEDMTAAIVNAMSVASKKLVVSDEAILNKATLIGQTVVDDINVTGKLIGTGGVFTGTVDFANITVTGTQIVNKLGANSISAEKVSGGSFAGKSFEGGEFTGGMFRTSEATLGGAIRIDQANGIRGWNSSGTRTFQVNNNDGSIDIAANLRATNSGGQGVVLVPQTASQGNAALLFTDDGSLGTSQAAIWRSTYTGKREPLRIRGAQKGGVVVEDYLSVEGNLDAVNGSYGNSIAVPSILTWASGGLSLRGENATMKLANDSNGNGAIAAPPVYDRTYSGQTANVYVTSAGTLGRATSSRRYKKYISDWAPSAETVLALQPRRWKPKVGYGDGEMDAEPSNDYYVGFIAEEVDDLGLTELVVYSEAEDGAPRPESLNYDRFPAAQQIILRDHEARIAALEAQIKELTDADRNR